MLKIIDGCVLAEKIKDKTVKEIAVMEKNCPPTKTRGGLVCQRPNLAIILVGDRPDSALYVELKEREAKKVGIDTHVYRLAAATPEEEIFSLVDFLNKDNGIDAILVQLPLPSGFDTDGIILAIDPDKDVDRFHPDNIEVLFKTCEHDQVIPPVIQVVLEMLNSINCPIEKKEVSIIYNSEIFGRSLARVLSCRGAHCTAVRSDSGGLKNMTSRADILISAVGKPNLITGDMIKKGAILIDIGITKQGKKVCGDVDFESVKNKAGYLTPVPGGVGPVTIAMLFKNTLELYKEKHCR